MSTESLAVRLARAEKNYAGALSCMSDELLERAEWELECVMEEIEALRAGTSIRRQP